MHIDSASKKNGPLFVVPQCLQVVHSLPHNIRPGTTWLGDSRSTLVLILPKRLGTCKARHHVQAAVCLNVVSNINYIVYFAHTIL